MRLGRMTHDPAAGDEALLNREEAEAALVELCRRQKAREVGKAIWGSWTKTIRAGGYAMRYLSKTYVGASRGGGKQRSLWISLHGGGECPKAVNDASWVRHLSLYELEEGVCVAPRAPTDAWNMWHKPHVDVLLKKLIAAQVALNNVDPNRVYLIGYSAGGDGVYQLAPRLADRFAAASMMAGHPNDACPLGLRNLPFHIFCGGDDLAYNRNVVAAEWGERLADLKQRDGEGGYRHHVVVYPGLGHWMEGRDAEALPMMARHIRNPWPRRVVWSRGGGAVVHPGLYWLRLDAAEVQEVPAETVVCAAVQGQTITLSGSRPLKGLTLMLRDCLLDLDAPVTVVGEAAADTHQPAADGGSGRSDGNGGRGCERRQAVELFQGAVARTVKAMEESMQNAPCDLPASATAALRIENWSQRCSGNVDTGEADRVENDTGAGAADPVGAVRTR
eukprot:GHVU01084290.1.p1 GENE.GHVU01084290.1~~GHVU01084290.1.p1  ORF type:complete len:447 (+),score=63.12 GHVU01084290.1:1399-2739(+)